ncbi:MAG TPA: intradiol ring-cleavage dioxygenase [Ferrovibrio sp.]|jgi:protocatechuate 3,4-dioxygenase beta subunit|uniref:dioxygenase family protein n=1 Tax=Ferrovibrio sp. TaxID=1917215 RepID=UPI002ED1FE61
MLTRRAMFMPALLLAAMPRSAWPQNGGRLPVAAREMTPTPSCHDGDNPPTEAAEEGPYFKTGSPERSRLLEPGMAGTPLRIGGYVLTRRCRPVERVLVDLWQADDAGRYDAEGYRLRGHQFTDAQGRWQFETLVPGLYTGRTRHIHFKLQAPQRAVLTTQLYFPDEPRNAQDALFNKHLLLAVAANEAGQIGRYDFVLDMA